MKNHNATALTYKLQDGRTMGYAEYGCKSGFPIFLFHGTPGSRIWFPKDDPIAKELKIRLIATDRPGFGLSDPKPNRQVLDYPNDVLELADHLELKSFSVIGTSGGSAYAAACAYALPERIKFCGIVAGISEFSKRKPPKGMCRENKMAFFLSKYLPFISRWALSQAKKLIVNDPKRYVASVQSQVNHLCPADQEVMHQKGACEHVLRHMKEAFRNSIKEAPYELAILAKRWGFEASQIKVPVQIWHGTADTLAPIEPMRNMARSITQCQTNFIKDQGHFLDSDDKIWQQILESVTCNEFTPIT